MANIMLTILMFHGGLQMRVVVFMFRDGDLKLRDVLAEVAEFHIVCSGLVKLPDVLLFVLCDGLLEYGQLLFVVTHSNLFWFCLLRQTLRSLTQQRKRFVFTDLSASLACFRE